MVFQFCSKAGVLLASWGFKRGPYYRRHCVGMEKQTNPRPKPSCAGTFLVNTSPCWHTPYNKHPCCPLQSYRDFLVIQHTPSLSHPPSPGRVCSHSLERNVPLEHPFVSTHSSCGAPVHGVLSPGVRYIAHPPTKAHGVALSSKVKKSSLWCGFMRAIRPYNNSRAVAKKRQPGRNDSY